MESPTVIQPVHIRPRDVAEQHSISIQVVYDAILSGKLKAAKLGPKSWIIRPADADAWIETASTPNVTEV